MLTLCFDAFINPLVLHESKTVYWLNIIVEKSNKSVNLLHTTVCFSVCFAYTKVM
jgi:hypothetical protein